MMALSISATDLNGWFVEVRDGAVSRVRQHVDFCLRAAFDNKCIRLGDQEVVRAVDDEHRRVVRPIQQRRRENVATAVVNSC
jgi:DNA-binding cell septation regulator SpoVG